MGAGGLRRDSRRDGQLARGQGATIEERRDDSALAGSPTSAAISAMMGPVIISAI
jgi:hypothetical protein